MLRLTSCLNRGCHCLGCGRDNRDAASDGQGIRSPTGYCPCFVSARHRPGSKTLRQVSTYLVRGPTFRSPMTVTSGTQVRQESRDCFRNLGHVLARLSGHQDANTADTPERTITVQCPIACRCPTKARPLSPLGTPEELVVDLSGGASLEQRGLPEGGMGCASFANGPEGADNRSLIA